MVSMDVGRRVVVVFDDRVRRAMFNSMIWRYLSIISYEMPVLNAVLTGGNHNLAVDKIRAKLLKRREKCPKEPV